MSLRAITWAFEAEGMRPTEKLVLLALADQANEDGTCWPRQSTIARRACIGRQAVNRALADLEKAGFLTSKFRYGDNGHTLGKSYTLSLSTTGGVAKDDRGCRPRRQGVSSKATGGVSPSTTGGVAQSDRGVSRKATVIEPSVEPPKNHNGATPPRRTDTDDFEAIWQARARRAGSDPKQSALKAYRARLKEGATHAEIAAGVDRYRAFIEATGKENTEYVLRFATFLGPDAHFCAAYGPPAEKTAPGPRIVNGRDTEPAQGRAGYGRKWCRNHPNRSAERGSDLCESCTHEARMRREPTSGGLTRVAF